MEGLNFGDAFQITEGDESGLYRVVACDPGRGFAVVRFAKPNPKKSLAEEIAAGTSVHNEPDFVPGTGHVRWLPRQRALILSQAGHLTRITIELDSIYYEGVRLELPDRSRPIHALTADEKRVFVMQDFVNPASLQEHIQKHGNIGALVSAALERVTTGAGHEAEREYSRSGIYKLWLRICQLGIDPTVLKRRTDKQGAPGVPRPCDPDGHKKPGRLTTDEDIEKRHTGVRPTPTQPGVSSQWTTVVLAMDAKIPSPKPSMTTRVELIQRRGFAPRVARGDGNFDFGDLVEGTFPNDRQVARILHRSNDAIERARQTVSSRYFENNLRGMRGKAHQGVGGPGHRWAIDSTVGDIFLVSSANRSWPIGRPYVYVMVDVWSTAAVGFYVCLRPPSWTMASQAVFAAAASSSLMSELMGFDTDLGLRPEPTLCASLMCDRGEYLSRAARLFGSKCLLDLAYAAPYRPDMKGHVEVLHRITKDRLYKFVPGAFDWRRKELESRPPRPHDACLTVQDYAAILVQVFRRYNLTADRRHRVDAHMKAAGVVPTPAGLWNWGHAVGIGLRRSFGDTDAIHRLLCREEATVTRTGVHFAKRDYECNEIDERQWTTHASLSGAYSVPAAHFHGSVSRIWVPNHGAKGYLKLLLSDTSTASPELTPDEAMDAEAYASRSTPKQNVDRKNASTSAANMIDAIVRNAQKRTAVDHEGQSADQPNMSEARQMELDALSGESTAPVAAGPQPESNSEEADEYYAQFREHLNKGEAVHG